MDTVKQLSYFNRLEVAKLGRAFRFRNEKEDPYEGEVFDPENQSYVEWLITNLQKIHIVSLFYAHKVEMYSIMIEYSTYLQDNEIMDIIEEYGYNLDDLQVREDNHLWANSYLRAEDDFANEVATYTREWVDMGLLEDKKDFKEVYDSLIEEANQRDNYWY